MWDVFFTAESDLDGANRGRGRKGLDTDSTAVIYRGDSRV